MIRCPPGNSTPGEREEEKGGGSDWVPDLELSMCTQEQDQCDGSE